MKKSWWLIVLVLAVPAALACSTPLDGKTYTASQDFCGRNYYLPNGIAIDADDIVIDCHNSVLQGDFKGTGILIKDRKNIEIKNCHIVNYNTGVHLMNAEGSDIHDNNLLRNYIGVRLENSAQNHLYENRDVSINKMLRSIFSTGNHIKYTNKNIEGDFCRHNSCNEYTQDTKPAVNILAEILKAAIEKWISMD